MSGRRRAGPGPQAGVSAEALDRVPARVVRLAAGYDPPNFDHVADPDATLFLCAVDHRTGYRAAHMVGGEGPFEGSDLLWALGLRATERGHPSLTAHSLRQVSGERVAEMFSIDEETVADPDRRAALWRDLASGLERDHEGAASGLLAAAGCHLGGAGGLLARLARYRAYADPLRKKSFLFAKICARRGWFEVHDPERWEVCADNVLMRLALRSGLVEPGPLSAVRASTLEAFKAVAIRAGVSPPVLDDLLWERGRDDPDLVGAEAGDLREPPRDPDSDWY